MGQVQTYDDAAYRQALLAAQKRFEEDQAKDLENSEIVKVPNVTHIFLGKKLTNKIIAETKRSANSGRGKKLPTDTKFMLKGHSSQEVEFRYVTGTYFCMTHQCPLVECPEK